MSLILIEVIKKMFFRNVIDWYISCIETYILWAECIRHCTQYVLTASSRYDLSDRSPSRRQSSLHTGNVYIYFPKLRDSKLSDEKGGIR